jgi:hypothetical protein
MTLMDAKIGNTKITVNDSQPAAANVVYTSAKASTTNVCIGSCSLAGTSGVLTLTPIDDVDGLVSNNTFTCPLSGWWIVWVNWGQATGDTTAAAKYTLNYSLNGGANVLMSTMESNSQMTHVPLQLKKGDTLKFPATAGRVTSFAGSYCFEFIQ